MQSMSFTKHRSAACKNQTSSTTFRGLRVYMHINIYSDTLVNPKATFLTSCLILFPSVPLRGGMST